MSPNEAVLSEELHDDARTLWDYHDLGHELRPCDVGIGLGSHDLGAATFTSELYNRGLFPWIVFTGSNAPTTLRPFPHGEAVHYREHALELGVPPEAILTESEATNTGENLEFTRQLLVENRIRARVIMLVCRPYQQRRAFATCKKLWPEVEVVCTAQPLSFEEYLATVGDTDHVLDMLVGDTQRITVYAERGFAIPQPVPAEVQAAYERLVAAGYTARLVQS